MQATTHGTRFSIDWMKSGLAALALAGALAIGGAAVNLARHDASGTATVSRAQTTAANDAARRHLLEINTLPQAAARTATHYRFLEMNLLPEGAIRTAIPNYHFLDINVLPESTIRTAVPNYHFRDVNVLPGDDQQMTPPVVINGRPS